MQTLYPDFKLMQVRNAHMCKLFFLQPQNYHRIAAFAISQDMKVNTHPKCLSCLLQKTIAYGDGFLKTIKAAGHIPSCSAA
jgi:hypothetical protein